jgi:hypothetical protein
MGSDWLMDDRWASLVLQIKTSSCEIAYFILGFSCDILFYFNLKSAIFWDYVWCIYFLLTPPMRRNIQLPSTDETELFIETKNRSIYLPGTSLFSL